jgi:DNA-binding transcriptional LysR family regulator
MRKQSAIADLGDLALFVRVVELRSFSAVARATLTTTSAVSKRVAHLEERLGVRLLARTTRKVVPTEAGAAFYVRAASILAAVDEAEHEIGGLRGTPRGTLRVSAPVVFGERHLAPLVGEFLRRYPDVRVELSLSDRFIDLVSERVDVALRIGALADSSLTRVRVGAVASKVVASPSYLRRAGAPTAPSDLLAHNCVRYAQISASREWRFRGPSGELSVPVVGNVELDHGGAMLAAVLGGVGIAKLPSFLVADAIADGRLVALLDEFALPPTGVHLLSPASAASLPKTKAFVAFAAEALRERIRALDRGAPAGLAASAGSS